MIGEGWLMNMTPTSCATCGWRGVLAGAFCPSCGAQLQDTMANSGPPPANDMPHTGGRIALLALAGALLIIFLTLFVVGIALGNRDASQTPPPPLAPAFPRPRRCSPSLRRRPLPRLHRHPKVAEVEARASLQPRRYLLRHQRLLTPQSSLPPTPTISSGGG